ncbi:MAG: hypothetical protein V1678_03945 [Candidatus Aenigmatarchaeota archaeon]
MKGKTALVLGSDDRRLGMRMIKNIVEENTEYSVVPSKTRQDIVDVASKFFDEYFRTKHHILLSADKLLGRDCLSSEKNLERKVLKEVRSNDVSVVMASVSFPYYNVINDIASAVKREFESVPIVGGGPFFVKDERLKASLEKSNFDAWCIGHSSPVIDFLNRYESKEIKFNQGKFSGRTEDIEGMYFKTEGKVSGSGVGRFPYKKLRNIPYKVSDEYEIYVETFGMSGCSNLCDYCCIQRNGQIPVDWWVKKIKEVCDDNDTKNVGIMHHEDSPFHPTSIGTTVNFWNQLKKHDLKPKLTGCYIDPLAISGNYDEVKGVIDDISVPKAGFFIGRETCTEEISNKLGRKLMGKLRTQEDLDTEARVIDRFLYDFPKANSGVSYIITPWETEKSANALVKEWKYIEERHETDIMKGPLIPFYGTELTTRCVDIVRDMPLAAYAKMGFKFNNPENIQSIIKAGKLYFN